MMEGLSGISRGGAEVGFNKEPAVIYTDYTATGTRTLASFSDQKTLESSRNPRRISRTEFLLSG